MRPPLAGKRAAARRVAEEVRRRLEPVERVLPVRLPPFVPGEGPGSAGADPAPQWIEPAGGEDAPGATAVPADDAAARIDAARERLRASIEPRSEDDA